MYLVSSPAWLQSFSSVSDQEKSKAAVKGLLAYARLLHNQRELRDMLQGSRRGGDAEIIGA